MDKGRESKNTSLFKARLDELPRVQLTDMLCTSRTLKCFLLSNICHLNLKFLVNNDVDPNGGGWEGNNRKSKKKKKISTRNPFLMGLLSLM